MAIRQKTPVGDAVRGFMKGRQATAHPIASPTTGALPHKGVFAPRGVPTQDTWDAEHPGENAAENAASYQRYFGPGHLTPLQGFKPGQPIPMPQQQFNPGWAKGIDPGFSRVAPSAPIPMGTRPGDQMPVAQPGGLPTGYQPAVDEIGKVAPAGDISQMNPGFVGSQPASLVDTKKAVGDYYGSMSNKSIPGSPMAPAMTQPVDKKPPMPGKQLGNNIQPLNTGR